MRRIVAITLLLVVGGTALAANGGASRQSTVTPQALAQGQQYAQVMVQTADSLSKLYVREVPVADLLEAGLSGLYEAAREPLPAGLKAELARVETDRYQLVEVVARFRARLGDQESLRDMNGIVISLKALPRVLDPYCGLVTGEDSRRANRYTEDPTRQNAGMELESVPDAAQLPMAPQPGFPGQPSAPSKSIQGPFRIRLVVPGGPAQRAGVRNGDLLTHIDGHRLEGDYVSQRLQRLNKLTPGGSPEMRLTVQRPGVAAPIVLTLTIGPYRPESVFGVRRQSNNSWDFMLDPEHKIGFARLGPIDTGSHTEMTQAVASLQAAGARGLILDLRGCPGGYLDPACAIAGLFLPTGSLVSTVRDRNGSSTNRFQVQPGEHIALNLPLVVLVGLETTGGGELIAASLQDHKRATIVGQRSFGKGSVQTTLTHQLPFPMPFKLTTGNFQRPSGKNLQRYPDSKPSDDWGVRPDVGFECPVSPDLSRHLKDSWQRLILRPAEDRTALPLDDPAHDPQREFALRAIRGLLK
jgi:C-terminal peptidase prc